MNNKIYLPLAALAAMAALTGCDENSWNDRYLDGFESDLPIEQKQSIDYTLVAADYKNIASNADNKAMAEAAGVSSQLSAVSSKGCFNDAVSAREYIPAWLNSNSNPYFTLTDGSSLRLTYKVETGLPEKVYTSAAAELYTVSEDDYIDVWGSDEDYIDAFAPSHPASKNLAAIVADYFDDAEAGQYVIVTYNETTQEPTFGGGAPAPAPEWKLSEVIGTLKPDQDVAINGVVSGVCGSGFTLTDATGTIFVYRGSFDVNTYAIGTQLTVTGSSTSYKGNLQIANGADIEVIGTQDYTYPAPTVYTAESLDAALERPSDVPAVYCQMTGRVAVNGNNINIVLSDDATAMGSIYYATDAQKAMLADGSTVTVTGWFISISGSRYCNMVVTSIEQGAASKASRRARTVRAAASVPSNVVNALYYFNGSSWSVPADFDVLAPADYTAMGMTHDDLSKPLEYLPTYLRLKYPYAKADDTRYVLCKVYASGATNYACYSYTFNGAEWVNNDGITEETAQFVRTGGKWIYDPNVTITLPAGKGQELSTLYFQACVDWVYENKCVPLGDTSITSGKFWVTSYGNNEYYSGTSAYQGNVDLRAGSARSQYPEGWGDLTNDQIVETMKYRFTHEVFPPVLSKLNPEAAPIDGIDVYYYINFSAYNGSATIPYVATYKVVGPAAFEFVSCTWDEE